MSDLVGNPEDLSSRVAARIVKLGCTGVYYKNLTRVSGMDRQICPEGHILASRGSPSDAKL